MRTAYKVIAHIIGAAVVVQAALIALSMFQVINIFSSGGTPSGPPMAAMIHGTLGTIVIPLLVIALLIVSLFAHAGLRWALWLVLAVAVQIALAMLAFEAPWVGLLHGLGAFAILGLAEVGARAVAHAPAHVPHVRAAAHPAI